MAKNLNNIAKETKKNLPIRVSYQQEGKGITSKLFASAFEAVEAFRKIMKLNVPAKIEWLSTPCDITIDAFKWSIVNEKEFAEHSFRMDIKKMFKEAGIKQSVIDLLLCVKIDELINNVIIKNKAFFTTLNGVGEKTAEKIISCLYGKVSFGSVVLGNVRKQFHERIRITLNRDWLKPGEEENGRKLVSPDQPWIRDTTKKRWSPIEEYAAALAKDENAIINVVSNIPELGASIYDLAARERAEDKCSFWEDVCMKGIEVDGKLYVFIGHGTNAAKDNSLLFCRADIAEKVVKEFERQVSGDWKITDAKWVAYLIGLQAVYAEPVNLPIIPEDFEFFPSLIQELEDDIFQVHEDGTSTVCRKKVQQNQFDGLSVVHFSAKKQNEMIQRLVDKDIERKEAIASVNLAIAKLKSGTERTGGMATKGLSAVFFDMHSYLHFRGVHTLHGRDIDDIVIFADETVLKTPIGEGKAYPTKEALCDAVREGFEYKQLLVEHELTPKDVPYQVIQTCYKAAPETVKKFAEEQAAELNALHSLKKTKKFLTKEQRTLVEFAPAVANVRFFSERMKTGFCNELDSAFGGKRIGQCFTMLLAPDLIAFAEHIGGLEVKGFIEPNHIVEFGADEGEYAFWRNPVLDPGSLRVVYNDKMIPEHLKRFFRFDTTVCMMSIKDTNITRIRGDFDGDKGSASKNKLLIKMFKEAHEKFGDYLVDWDPMNTNKGFVTRETQLEYASRLCRMSDLGMTCTGLNLLYAGKMMDRETCEISQFDATLEDIANCTTRANNQVDAGKHGAKTYKVTESVVRKTSISKQQMPLQPFAKNYRDMHDCMAKSLAAGGSREKLDKLAVDSFPRYGSLDIYFGVLSDNVDRTFHVDDLIDEKFDVTSVMYTPKVCEWGLTGFIRMGKFYVKELGRCVDEGLFQSICRRTARDYELIENENPEDKERNMDEATFSAKVRICALAEIEQFAKACGKTLEDAFDYATWYMFTKCDVNYAPKGQDEKYDNAMLMIRDQLWRGYWMIFGGMLKDRIEELTADSIDMDNIDVAI